MVYRNYSFSGNFTGNVTLSYSVEVEYGKFYNFFIATSSKNYIALSNNLSLSIGRIIRDMRDKKREDVVKHIEQLILKNYIDDRFTVNITPYCRHPWEIDVVELFKFISTFTDTVNNLSSDNLTKALIMRDTIIGNNNKYQLQRNKADDNKYLETISFEEAFMKIIINKKKEGLK
jgi:hypothetical protein